jgi:hypothetical protein
MPLHWTIDSRTKLLVAVADGDVGLRDVEHLLDVVAGSNALSYRKLFDARRGKTQMSSTELLAIGVRLRALHATTPVLGPLAFVVRDQSYGRVAPVLGILAVPKRPMRVFNTVEKARAWLDSPAITAQTPG